MKAASHFHKPLSLWTIYVITAAIMFALKMHYSLATAEQLRWVLVPVARMVQWVDGQAYGWVSSVGFVRADQQFTIAPACAGLNFMIMALGLTVVGFVHHLRRLKTRFLWLVVAFAMAYSLTIATNALRIVVAIHLYESGAAMGWFTPERLHRLAGSMVYFSALGLYYAMLRRIMIGDIHPASITRGRRQTGWLPWAWYVTGAVGVPAANQLLRGRPLPGWEYCLSVVVASALVWAVAIVGYRFWQSASPPASQ